MTEKWYTGNNFQYQGQRWKVHFNYLTLNVIFKVKIQGGNTPGVPPYIWLPVINKKDVPTSLFFEDFDAWLVY